MKKLNNKKLRWILREVRRKRYSVYRIAKQQEITPVYVRKLRWKYRDLPFYLIDQIRLQKCGRKPTPMTKEEVDTVIEVRKNTGFGAVIIEKILAERGIRMSHVRIHKILLQEGLANKEPNKSRRRKWIRWQRRHSNSLWHTDWFWHKGDWNILYEDDASRLITGSGGFKDATSGNSIKVFDAAVSNWGKPRQLLSDHGTQFCENEDQNYRFREHITSIGVKHILARVKHPQTNGKMERLVYTMKRLIDLKGSLQEAVRFYNEERPHMSLENGHLRTPLQAFHEKMGKN